MSTQAINIFEVLDNFFGSQDCPSAEQSNGLNNRQIRELREHILSFYNYFGFSHRGEYETRLYLGSFLCSPPFTIESSPYISSALLCSDSIILFDPLHYWFCEEQYLRTRLTSAPPGWKDFNTKRPDYARTRQYLARSFPWLYDLRLLVDAGIIVLIPAEQTVFSNLTTVKETARGIKNLSEPIERLADRFSPDEVTVDDNRKGLFAFTGGHRTKQIRREISRGIEQFSKDIVIANATGAIYTAPFRWEQLLGSIAFNEYAATKCHVNLVEGIRNLRLPILANLSPKVLIKIHKDSGYAKFRAGLVEALRNIDAEVGSQDFVNRVAEIERDILLPKVEALHQEVRSGRFKRATNALQEGIMTFVQTFIGTATSGVDMETSLTASGIAGTISSVIEILKGRVQSTDRRVWAQLLPEKPSLSIYGSPLTLKQQGVSGWEIDPHPSLSIRVSKGLIKFPWVASNEASHQVQ